MTMDTLTTYLFASPSVAEGIGRILDFGGTLTEYNSSLTPQQADAIAISSDWRMVGQDIATAMSAYAVQAEDAARR